MALAAMTFTLGASQASAAPISWATWTGGTFGLTAGTAVGTLSPSGIGVSYLGEMRGFDTAQEWLPVSSFTGGIVDNAPPSGPAVARDGVALIGATGATNVVTFSAPVVDPILAIWSLGQPGLQARFTFPVSQPFSIEGGGPNSEFGGASIFAGGVCPANTVCGNEGNGVVRFIGTYSQISWTNPLAENYYTFTVGAPTVTAPEPAALLLLSAGLVGGALRRRAGRGSRGLTADRRGYKWAADHADRNGFSRISDGGRASRG